MNPICSKLNNASRRFRIGSQMTYVVAAVAPCRDRDISVRSCPLLSRFISRFAAHNHHFQMQERYI